MEPFVQVPEIPTLQKRDERDRKGGALWFGRGASSGGLLGTGRIAAAIVQMFGPSSWLGGIFASSLGPSLALGLLLMVGTVAVGAGMAILSRFGGNLPGGVRRPILEGVGASGLRGRVPTDRSLNYLSGANKGQIVFESEQPTAVQPQTFESGDAKSNKGQDLASDRQPDSLRGKIGALTQNAEGMGANTAAGTRLGSNPYRLKSGSDFNLPSNFGNTVGNAAPQFHANLGKMKQFSNGVHGVSGSGKAFMKNVSSRALGQAHFAGYMSQKGAGASNGEKQKTYSADAFDQGKTQGGMMSGLPQIGPTATAIPLGGGAPGGASVPSITGKNFTPYQSLMDQAGQLSSQASSLKTASIILFVLGAAFIAAAFGLNWWYALIGAALIAAGFAMLNQANQMSAQADQIAAQIQQQFGQQAQGQIVKDCSAAAVANGTAPQSCSSSQNQDVTQSLQRQQDIQRQMQLQQQLQQQQLQQQMDQRQQNQSTSPDPNSEGQPISQ